MPVADGDEVRVLIVDDHRIMRLGLRQLLRHMDRIYHVKEAESGKQALELIPELDPDLILTDISMKGMSGIELTRQVKERHLDVRVLIVSMHDEPNYVREAFAAGADGYVVKYNLDEEVLKAVDALLSGKSYLCKVVRRYVSDDECDDHSGVV